VTTLVLQSFRTHDVHPWIDRCMATVRAWADQRGHAYEFVGDELLDLAPGWYRDRAAGRMTLITDLARLILIRDRLDAGARLAVWVDADVAVFRPDRLIVGPKRDEAFCEEAWMHERGAMVGLPAWLRKPIAVRNINNCVCAFRRASAFLPSYIDRCLETVRTAARLNGRSVGTELLTAVHNRDPLELIPGVALLSGFVVRDLRRGGGASLALHNRSFPGEVAAANLTLTKAGRGRGLDRLVDDLVRTRGALLNPSDPPRRDAPPGPAGPPPRSPR